MKRILFIAMLLAGVLLPQPANARKWLGGDISMLRANEQAGVVYRDILGNEVKTLKFFKQQGWDMMRVRLFVDPKQAHRRHRDEGVCQDLPYVIDLCRDIKKAGFKIMLDFHYSDTWADPAKQFTPKRWVGLLPDELADSVYSYTRECLLAMRAAGVAPDMIQVGNEITFGMTWPIGRVDPIKDHNWNVLGALLRAGCKACREVCPKAKIIIHTEKAGVWEMTQGYYDHLAQQQVDYDIIGLSYYPMWHGTIPNLGVTLDKLAERYPRKDVMIVEAAYYYMHNGQAGPEEDFSQCLPGTIEGQRLFTAQLVEELRKHKNVTGLFWWFPEENNYGTDRRGGLNRGLFNNATGCALPAMYQLSRFKK